ncbi:lipocalin family protein [Phenylobacterium sp.]|uniref:lipocalin family protein n=2 Tax=Phenylobacterium sp. TaxID=1871053 RepID=UPI00391A152B
MMKRLILAAAAAALFVAAPASAEPEKIELTKMMGRWYEVARVPNKLQDGCEAGASDWTPREGGFAVVQRCWKDDGGQTTWKAKATADPSNTRIKMSFFGGLVSQDYRVLEHRIDQGWLILGTANGKYVWLMSQKPTLPAAIKAQAVARMKQLGFDPARLEFPGPPRS